MKVILASQSTRRRYLINKMGVKFTAVTSNFDEYMDESRPVIDIVKEMALGKALEVALEYPDCVVIGGDLIVAIDRKQLGKPKSSEEAKQMLRTYNNRTHQVLSSVCVVYKKKNYQKVMTDISNVTLGGYDEEFIKKYVGTGITKDKGGGYALQHLMLKPYIKKIDGDVDSIIGMPTKSLALMLKELGIGSKPLELTYDDLLNIKELSDE